MIQRSLSDFADTKAANGKHASSDTGESKEKHCIADKDSESAGEICGLEISLKEIIPVSGKKKSE